MNARRSPRGASYLNPPASTAATRRYPTQRWWGAALAVALAVGLGSDVGATESPTAWREAFLAGRMPRKVYQASPSSPTSGLIGS